MCMGETKNKQRHITNKGDLTMWLIRRNNDLVAYPRLLNRYINDLWNDFPTRFPKLEEDSVVWRPSLDLSESENEYKVLADLPGLSKEDIKISLRDNVLTISGERKYEKKDDSKNYSSAERTYGKFARSVSLPDKIKESEIKASYKNGVLTVSLPKSEEAKPREISIS
jgi:HSP20 family protein